MIPRATTRPPERVVQKVGGTAMKAVLTLSSRVKMMTERPREAVIIRGRRRWLSLTEPAMMIGRRGRTQGEATVRIPAMKEMRRRGMLYELRITKYE